MSIILHLYLINHITYFLFLQFMIQPSRQFFQNYGATMAMSKFRYPQGLCSNMCTFLHVFYCILFSLFSIISKLFINFVD